MHSPTIKIMQVCRSCKETRYDDNAFLECRCVLKHVLSDEQEALVKSEIQVFRTLSNNLFGYYVPSLENIIDMVQYIPSMNVISRSLVVNDHNSRTFTKLSELISNVRRNGPRSYDKARSVEICSKLMYMLPNAAKIIMYSDCLFVENGSACFVSNCNRMCSVHIGWLYVAHNEADIAIGDPNITRMCIEYIQPEYHTIPGCIPSQHTNRAANKRKIEVVNE